MDRDKLIKDVAEYIHEDNDIGYIEDMLDAILIDGGLFTQVQDVSDEIRNGRTRSQVMLSLMEEVGELALEVKIVEGYSHKPRGKDGVVGEAIDVILCALDLITIHDSGVTQEDVDTIVTAKLAKWKAKSILPRSVLNDRPFDFEPEMGDRNELGDQ